MKEDEQLIERTLNGDMQAFRWLISKHERLVVHVVGRIVQDNAELEELCQDIFMRVYEKLDTFRGESKFSTWIASIAYRMSLNYLKKKKGFRVALEEIPELGDAGILASDFVEQQDRTKVLEQAISMLPPAYRTVITLFHMQELSYDEVAEIMSMPLGTVKNYLFRGRQQLKEILERFNYKYEI